MPGLEDSAAYLNSNDFSYYKAPETRNFGERILDFFTGYDPVNAASTANANAELRNQILLLNKQAELSKANTEFAVNLERELRQSAYSDEYNALAELGFNPNAIWMNNGASAASAVSVPAPDVPSSSLSGGPSFSRQAKTDFAGKATQLATALLFISKALPTLSSAGVLKASAAQAAVNSLFNKIESDMPSTLAR